jgi:hypothetical protein
MVHLCRAPFVFPSLSSSFPFLSDPPFSPFAVGRNPFPLRNGHRSPTRICPLLPSPVFSPICPPGSPRRERGLLAGMSAFTPSSPFTPLALSPCSLSSSFLSPGSKRGAGIRVESSEAPHSLRQTTFPSPYSPPFLPLPPTPCRWTTASA